MLCYHTIDASRVARAAGCDSNARQAGTMFARDLIKIGRKCYDSRDATEFETRTRNRLCDVEWESLKRSCARHTSSATTST